MFVFLSTISLVINGKISFLLWLNSISECVCVYGHVHSTFSLSTHPLMETGCFCILIIVKNTAMNMWVQISLQESDFISFRNIQIAGSYGSSSLFFFFFFSFLGPHLRHMEASRLGIKSELHLPTYATAMWDPSHVWDLYHSSRQL